MRNTKLLEILNTLSSDDWVKFNRYLMIRVGRNTEARGLFVYIKRFRKNLNSDKLKIEVAHGALFPDISKKSFVNILSKLKKHVDHYLVSDLLDENSIDFELKLLETYRNRGLFHQFNLKRKKMALRLSSQKSYDIWDDYYNLKLNHIYYFSDNPDKKELGHLILSDCMNYLKSFSKNLATFYVSANLHYEEIYNKRCQENIEDLLPFSKIGIRETVLTDILNHLIEIKKGDKENSVLYIQNVLFDQKEEIDLSEEVKSSCLEILIKHASERVKIGDLSAFDLLLTSYEYGFSSGFLLINGKIPVRRFVNYINVAGVSGEFERAQTFVKEYSSFLPVKHRNVTIQISNAQLAFNAGQYGKTLQILAEVSLARPPELDMRIRWLLLCSYYMTEQNNTDFIDAQIRSYNNYIYYNKKKLSKTNIEGGLNLSKFIKSLFYGKDSKRLLEELNEEKNVVFRKWLKGIISEKIGK